MFSKKKIIFLSKINGEIHELETVQNTKYQVKKNMVSTYSSWLKFSMPVARPRHLTNENPKVEI
jgi:hypothetical protein